MFGWKWDNKQTDRRYDYYMPLFGGIINRYWFYPGIPEIQWSSVNNRKIVRLGL